MPSTETAMRHPQTLATLPLPPSDPPDAGIAPEDWDLMLDAVTARLRTHSTSQQAVMLECAAALEQLHAALRHERAKASAELAGIRDGEQRARRMARHDGLTGLPNRNDFHEQLDRLLAERSGGCQTIGVLYLDLDGFKHINDTHGHATGDTLFQVVSAPVVIDQLQLIVRPSIGVAICPDDAATAELLLRRADAAMYSAKRQQCGYVFFDRLDASH